MKLIAFDTSTEACSAAIYINGQLNSQYELAPRRHAELLLPMVDNLLADAGIQLNDLDAVAFGQGPGAFTGVRIATAVAQGLAFSAGLPVIPVSSLAALAQSVNGKAEYILSAIDARMNEIYFGVYKSGNTVELVETEKVISPDKISFTPPASCFGVGSGWDRYSGILAGIFKKQLSGYDNNRYPDAIDVAVLAATAFKKGILIKAEDVAPVYLRNNVTG